LAKLFGNRAGTVGGSVVGDYHPPGIGQVVFQELGQLFDALGKVAFLIVNWNYYVN
jgi:hypothetical protein